MAYNLHSARSKRHEQCQPALSTLSSRPQICGQTRCRGCVCLAIRYTSDERHHTRSVYLYLANWTAKWKHRRLSVCYFMDENGHKARQQWTIRLRHKQGPATPLGTALTLLLLMGQTDVRLCFSSWEFKMSLKSVLTEFQNVNTISIKIRNNFTILNAHLPHL